MTILATAIINKICIECNRPHNKKSRRCSMCHSRVYRHRKHIESPMMKCICGCGTLIHSIGKDGKPARYVLGHFKKEKIIQIKNCINCNKEVYRLVKNRCNECYQFLRHIESPLIPCECPNNCGEMIHSVGVSGHKVHYKFGHQISKGENCIFWKGGRFLSSDGYWLVLKPDHPKCDNDGYIREHRLIYEEYYKCCLLPWIHIHHINEIKTDNRIENLQALTPSEHSSLHIRKKNPNIYLKSI